MGTRTIKFDDLTGREIEINPTTVSVTLTLPGIAEPIKADWDLSPNTLEAVKGLVEDSDLAGFILRLRPLVTLATTDSSTIREWLRKNHPELKVPEHGRLSAEHIALYRREVVTKVTAPDATPAKAE